MSYTGKELPTNDAFDLKRDRNQLHEAEKEKILANVDSVSKRNDELEARIQQLQEENAGLREKTVPPAENTQKAIREAQAPVAGPKPSANYRFKDDVYYRAVIEREAMERTWESVKDEPVKPSGKTGQRSQFHRGANGVKAGQAHYFLHAIRNKLQGTIQQHYDGYVEFVRGRYYYSEFRAFRATFEADHFDRWTNRDEWVGRKRAERIYDFGWDGEPTVPEGAGKPQRPLEERVAEQQAQRRLEPDTSPGPVVKVPVEEYNPADFEKTSPPAQEPPPAAPTPEPSSNGHDNNDPPSKPTTDAPAAPEPEQENGNGKDKAIQTGAMYVINVDGKPTLITDTEEIVRIEYVGQTSDGETHVFTPDAIVAGPLAS